MPEHVHLLITESKMGYPSVAIQVLKQRVSLMLLREQRSSAGAAEAHFWERRFYDFNVYTGKKISEKLNYMHLNPVKRKLVIHLKDWPWSSWSHYASCGPILIPIDRWDGHAVRTENLHPLPKA
jgi:putative transposase